MSELAPLQQNDRATVMQYLPLVERVAKRVARRLPRSVALDDLVGAGSLGLIDAVKRFDPARAPSFSAYAELRIRGAILDHLRALDWLPRSMRASVKRGESDAAVLSIDDRRGPGCDGFAANQPSASTVLEQREQRDRLSAAIAALPERTRRVLGLYYVDELTLKEVGQVLGVTESRACQLHGEAVLRLRGALECGAAA
ncbi:MAG: sigma-70 family RNA polymerase sigma factor [Deltaproteobacteria bacterium]|nr:sigma-70 family RNA polymerase sigma factor [Deltaproteobacteria bacterium]